MKKTFTQLNQKYQALNAREQKIVLWGGVFLALLIFWQIWDASASAIGNSERRSQRTLQTQIRVEQLLSEYRHISTQLKTNVDTSQVSYIERLASRLNLQPRFVSARPINYGTQQAYEARFEGLYAEEVDTLLQTLQAERAAVLRMHLARRFDDATRADLVIIIQRGA